MPSRDRKLRILAIDDEELYIHNIVGLLAKNYKIIVALSGREGLKLAHSTPPPDLILLDIMMPDMDGYQVCQELKRRETTRAIPVIFITAETTKRGKLEGLESGAVDYLTKPVQAEELLIRVQTHLKIHLLTEELRAKNAALRREIAAGPRRFGRNSPCPCGSGKKFKKCCLDRM